jgi:hypothetical protein
LRGAERLNLGAVATLRSRTALAASRGWPASAGRPVLAKTGERPVCPAVAGKQVRRADAFAAVDRRRRRELRDWRTARARLRLEARPPSVSTRATGRGFVTARVRFRKRGTVAAVALASSSEKTTGGLAAAAASWARTCTRYRAGAWSRQAEVPWSRNPVTKGSALTNY